MATPLRYVYNPVYFDRLCPVLRQAIPGFDCREFIFRVFNNSWPDLQLKQRIRHITLVLHHFLSKEFPIASRQIVTISRALKNGTKQNFGNIFLAEYIEVFGQDYPDESLSAMEEIAQIASCEFAIRPFLIRYPEKTLGYVYRWCESKDLHVRRLSSEGCRPRLPWAIDLPAFKKDPAPLLTVLERLKEDPSDYVRRSVANHLHDIARDHSELVTGLVKTWRGKHPRTDWIIRRACVSFLEDGNSQALSPPEFNPERIRQ